jgi:hypothetical protein
MKTYRDLKLTLRYNTQLNSKFWVGESMKPEVRQGLLRIAEEWAEFANIPSNAIIDIVLVGGNANYNYTKYSDLDLHLIVSKEDIADCPDLIDDYLRDKKQLWALTHDIQIYGHDVELYAQDRRDPAPSGQGVFSLVNSLWLRRPTYQDVNLADPNIAKKVMHYMEKIDFLIDNRADDRAAFEKLKDKLRDMRASAIQRGGEFAVENLVFKELRNRGYLDKMSEHLRNLKDTSLSID